MLLRLIKNSNFFGIFLIPLAGFLFWMQSFQSPGNIGVTAKESTMPLYYIVQALFKGLGFWQVLAGFIIVLLNSLIIARISSSFLLYKKGSALPGIIYITTISSVRTLQTLHPLHIATLCILIAISYIFDTYQKRVEIPYTFNASFFIAVASLFYLPAALLFPLIWIGIFVLQKSDNWRLLVVPILGFSVPWFFIWAVSFLNDTSNNILPLIKNILWSRNNAYLFDPGFLAKSALMLFLIICGTISILTDYQSIKISTRKYLIIFYWMFGIIVMTALFLIMIGNEVVSLLMIPVAVIISYFFLAGRKYFWKELFLIVYAGVMVAAYLLKG
jgi:hypothetical protein